MNPWALALAGGASLASGLLGKGDNLTQVPLETPDQTAARQYLMNFVNSGGKSVGYNAGETYGKPLGDFSMTSAETAGQGNLMGLIGSSSPSYLVGAGNTLNDLFAGSYDPNNDGGVYKGLSAGIDYNTGEAVKGTKQNLAYAGNLYSTDAARQLGNVQIQGANAKSGLLANLYQNYTNQKLQGVGQAGSLATTGQNLDLGKIGAAYQYGGLPRTLNTASDQASYQEWIRAHQDLLTPVQTAGTILNSTPQFGVPSVPTQNPWQSVLQNLGQYAGMYSIFGNKKAA